MTAPLKQLTFLFLATIGLTSCEKETFIEYYIHNQSTSSIVIDGTDIIYSTDINQIVASNEKIKISNWSKRGLQTELFEPTTMFGYDMLIINGNGDTLQKDYKIVSNWLTHVEDQRKTASHVYILEVTDADF
jgi:hypothetical protein